MPLPDLKRLFVRTGPYSVSADDRRIAERNPDRPESQYQRPAAGGAGLNAPIYNAPPKPVYVSPAQQQRNAFAVFWKKQGAQFLLDLQKLRKIWTPGQHTEDVASVSYRGTTIRRSVAADKRTYAPGTAPPASGKNDWFNPKTPQDSVWYNPQKYEMRPDEWEAATSYDTRNEDIRFQKQAVESVLKKADFLSAGRDPARQDMANMSPETFGAYIVVAAFSNDTGGSPAEIQARADAIIAREAARGQADRSQKLYDDSIKTPRYTDGTVAYRVGDALVHSLLRREQERHAQEEAGASWLQLKRHDFWGSLANIGNVLGEVWEAGLSAPIKSAVAQWSVAKQANGVSASQKLSRSHWFDGSLNAVYVPHGRFSTVGAQREFYAKKESEIINLANAEAAAHPEWYGYDPEAPGHGFIDGTKANSFIENTGTFAARWMEALVTRLPGTIGSSVEEKRNVYRYLLNHQIARGGYQRPENLVGWEALIYAGGDLVDSLVFDLGNVYDAVQWVDGANALVDVATKAQRAQDVVASMSVINSAARTYDLGMAEKAYLMMVRMRGEYAALKVDYYTVAMNYGTLAARASLGATVVRSSMHIEQGNLRAMAEAIEKGTDARLVLPKGFRWVNQKFGKPVMPPRTPEELVLFERRVSNAGLVQNARKLKEYRGLKRDASRVLDGLNNPDDRAALILHLMGDTAASRIDEVASGSHKVLTLEELVARIEKANPGAGRFVPGLVDRYRAAMSMLADADMRAHQEIVEFVVGMVRDGSWTKKEGARYLANIANTYIPGVDPEDFLALPVNRWRSTAMGWNKKGHYFPLSERPEFRAPSVVDIWKSPTYPHMHATDTVNLDWLADRYQTGAELVDGILYRFETSSRIIGRSQVVMDYLHMEHAHRLQHGRGVIGDVDYSPTGGRVREMFLRDLEHWNGGVHNLTPRLREFVERWFSFNDGSPERAQILQDAFRIIVDPEIPEAERKAVGESLGVIFAQLEEDVAFTSLQASDAMRALLLRAGGTDSTPAARLARSAAAGLVDFSDARVAVVIRADVPVAATSGIDQLEGFEGLTFHEVPGFGPESIPSHAFDYVDGRRHEEALSRMGASRQYLDEVDKFGDYTDRALSAQDEYEFYRHGLEEEADFAPVFIGAPKDRFVVDTRDFYFDDLADGDLYRYVESPDEVRARAVNQAKSELPRFWWGSPEQYAMSVEKYADELMARRPDVYQPIPRDLARDSEVLGPHANWEKLSEEKYNQLRQWLVPDGKAYDLRDPSIRRVLELVKRMNNKKTAKVAHGQYEAMVNARDEMMNLIHLGKDGVYRVNMQNYPGAALYRRDVVSPPRIGAVMLSAAELHVWSGPSGWMAARPDVDVPDVPAAMSVALNNSGSASDVVADIGRRVMDADYDVALGHALADALEARGYSVGDQLRVALHETQHSFDGREAVGQLVADYLGARGLAVEADEYQSFESLFEAAAVKVANDPELDLHAFELSQHLRLSALNSEVSQLKSIVAGLDVHVTDMAALDARVARIPDEIEAVATAPSKADLLAEELRVAKRQLNKNIAHRASYKSQAEFYDEAAIEWSGMPFNEMMEGLKAKYGRHSDEVTHEYTEVSMRAEAQMTNQRNTWPEITVEAAQAKVEALNRQLRAERQLARLNKDVAPVVPAEVKALQDELAALELQRELVRTHDLLLGNIRRKEAVAKLQDEYLRFVQSSRELPSGGPKLRAAVRSRASVGPSSPESWLAISPAEFEAVLSPHLSDDVIMSGAHRPVLFSGVGLDADTYADDVFSLYGDAIRRAARRLDDVNSPVGQPESYTMADVIAGMDALSDEFGMVENGVDASRAAADVARLGSDAHASRAAILEQSFDSLFVKETGTSLHDFYDAHASIGRKLAADDLTSADTEIARMRYHILEHQKKKADAALLGLQHMQADLRDLVFANPLKRYRGEYGRMLLRVQPYLKAYDAAMGYFRVAVLTSLNFVMGNAIDANFKNLVQGVSPGDVLSSQKAYLQSLAGRLPFIEKTIKYKRGSFKGAQALDDISDHAIRAMAEGELLYGPDGRSFAVAMGTIGDSISSPEEMARLGAVGRVMTGFGKALVDDVELVARQTILHDGWEKLTEMKFVLAMPEQEDAIRAFFGLAPSQRAGAISALPREVKKFLLGPEGKRLLDEAFADAYQRMLLTHYDYTNVSHAQKLAKRFFMFPQYATQNIKFWATWAAHYPTWFHRLWLLQSSDDLMNPTFETKDGTQVSINFRYLLSSNKFSGLSGMPENGAEALSFIGLDFVPALSKLLAHVGVMPTQSYKSGIPLLNMLARFSNTSAFIRHHTGGVGLDIPRAVDYLFAQFLDEIDVFAPLRDKALGLETAYDEDGWTYYNEKFWGDVARRAASTAIPYQNIDMSRAEDDIAKREAALGTVAFFAKVFPKFTENTAFLSPDFPVDDWERTRREIWYGAYPDNADEYPENHIPELRRILGVARDDELSDVPAWHAAERKRIRDEYAAAIDLLGKVFGDDKPWTQSFDVVERSLEAHAEQTRREVRVFFAMVDDGKRRIAAGSQAGPDRSALEAAVRKEQALWLSQHDGVRAFLDKTSSDPRVSAWNTYRDGFGGFFNALEVIDLIEDYDFKSSERARVMREAKAYRDRYVKLLGSRGYEFLADEFPTMDEYITSTLTPLEKRVGAFYSHDYPSAAAYMDAYRKLPRDVRSVVDAWRKAAGKEPLSLKPYVRRSYSSSGSSDWAERYPGLSKMYSMKTTSFAQWWNIYLSLSPAEQESLNDSRVARGKVAFPEGADAIGFDWDDWAGATDRPSRDFFGASGAVMDAYFAIPKEDRVARAEFNSEHPELQVAFDLHRLDKAEKSEAAWQQTIKDYPEIAAGYEAWLAIEKAHRPAVEPHVVELGFSGEKVARKSHTDTARGAKKRK